jgi:hypothetical protein
MTSDGEKSFEEMVMRIGLQQGFRPIALLIMLSFILSACIQVEVESEFESDGSAIHLVSTTIDRTFIDDEMIAGQLDGEFDFDEIEREAEDAGFNAERIDTAERIGVRISTYVEDNENLGDMLAQLFEAAGGEGLSEGLSIDGFEGSFTASSGLGGTRYRFELTVDSGALFDQGEFDDELDDEFEMEVNMDMLRGFMNLTYTASMPGEVKEHNGTELGGGRVQWDLPFEGTHTFYAESEDGSGFSIALVLGIAVGVLALILIIVGAVMLTRGQKSPTLAEPNSPPTNSSGIVPDNRVNERRGQN